MSARQRHEVLRIAVIVDGESCEELHQTQPADVVIARAASLGGAASLRGRSFPGRSSQLAIYDGGDRPRDYRKRAPLWLGIGLLVALGGGALFAHELSQREPATPLAEAGRGDLSAFVAAETQGTGGLGFMLVLLGLLPLVVGLMGLAEPPAEPSPTPRGPGDSRAPGAHKLFEWVEGEGAYYVDIPPETRGKIVFGETKTTVVSLQGRRGEREALRLRLGPKAKGKLFIGESKIIFQMAKPAREVAKPPFPVEYLDPLAHLRPSSLDIVTFGAAVGVAILLGVWAAYLADRTPPPPAERFIREMGVPVTFHEPGPEEPELSDSENRAPAKMKNRKKPAEQAPKRPHEISDGAFDRAGKVGIARTISIYGPPGEGTLLAIIEDGETDLEQLFAAGVVRTDGRGKIGEFVAGGEGISSTGTLAANAGLRTGDGPAAIGKQRKREREVVAESTTDEVVGEIDAKAVKATIRRRMPGLEACYEKALRTNPGLGGGKMTYTITINPFGRVTEVEIEADTVGDASVRSCTTAKIKGWRFLVEEDAGQESEVTFNVVFAD